MRKWTYVSCLSGLLLLVAPAVVLADCVDTCAGAPSVNVSALPYSDSYADGDCTACTDDIDNGCLNSYDGGEDSFYHVVNDTGVDQWVNLNVVIATTWTGVAVFVDCGAPSTCLISNTGSTARTVDENVCLAPGEEIYIQIDTYPTPNCALYDITISATTPCPATNDTCADAVASPADFEIAGDGTWSGSTGEDWVTDDYSGAGPTVGTCIYAGDSVAPDVIYYFDVANGSGSIDLEMDPATGFDAVLWMVTDCADPVGSAVNCADDVAGGSAETLSLSGLADGRYYVICDGYGGSNGEFDLNVTGASVPVELKRLSVE